MLLTGAHVSVVLSSAVLALFTALLFAAGCHLQQRTVRSLRAEMRPRLATTSVAVTAVTGLVVPFGCSADDGNGRVDVQRHGAVYAGCGGGESWGPA